MSSAGIEPVAPPVVIVPGLRAHIESHWQTILAAQLPKSVTRIELDNLSCGSWAAHFGRTPQAIDGPVVLVAHSGGVMITVHWAREHRRPIQGAMRVASADSESPLPEDYLSQKILGEVSVRILESRQ